MDDTATYGLTFASSESKGIAERRLQEKRENGRASVDLDQPEEKEMTPEEYFALKRQRMRERHQPRYAYSFSLSLSPVFTQGCELVFA